MPELILFLLVVVVAAGAGWFVGGAARAKALPPPASARARWNAAHRTEGDRTVVHVQLREPGDAAPVLERRDVGTVANLDPDYDARLDELMTTARERAVLLDLNRT